MSQHMSGAHKRKKKREEEEKYAKLPKISSFFKTSGDASTSAASSHSTTEQGSSIEHVNVSPGSIVQSSLQDSVTTLDEGSSTQTEEEQIQIPAVSEAPIQSSFIESVLAEEHITDRGHYPITIQDGNIKRFIITNGPCRPKGPFPRDEKDGRCFSASFYERVTKTGLKLPVTWLCYSPKLNAAYCEPCWLFGDRKKQGFEPAWAKGIQKWQRLSAKIQIHENSQSHIEACIVYDQWRRNKTIDEESEKTIRRESMFWRQALHRIVNVTLTMAMANLAFRGHREKIGEINNGNFLTIVELLAEYDPVLKDILQRPQGTVKYLSPQIQNELISLLASKIEEDIVSEIQKSQFFSIIMDTTQDIGKIDQLSQVFRYVIVERDENFRATGIKIEEAFLGFQSVEDQSAAGLEHTIVETIEKKGLDLSKCRGQGYDGAATMSGIYTGVQARIISKEKNALYIHCAAHNLNLVLQDAVSNITEISNFFDVVQSLYKFFGESVKRWAFLASFTSESTLTLKQLCPTRWASRYDSVLALRFRFKDILQALSKIIILSTKPKERDEASVLKRKLESFQFVFLIVIQAKILENVNSVSKMLQSKDMDLSSATKLIDNANKVLSNFRNNYEEVKRTAVSLAENWGIQAKFENKRVKKVKQHFDELCVDERLQDPEARFKTTVFYRCLDIAINQLHNRFTGMNTVVQRFQILQPATLSAESDDTVFKEATKLREFYQDDLSNDFPGQLLSFRSALKEDIRISSSIRDLAILLLVDNSGLSSTLPDVCIAFLLFLTLPVTVSSAERSFSKLKLIKNYLRSTMSQQRLSHLALLSVENERARKLDIHSMVDKFSEAKARRRTF